MGTLLRPQQAINAVFLDNYNQKRAFMSGNFGLVPIGQRTILERAGVALFETVNLRIQIVYLFRGCAVSKRGERATSPRPAAKLTLACMSEELIENGPLPSHESFPKCSGHYS